ncbi:MAG: hypothetical protein ACYDA1_10995 [Vulcanimicrobiaceae bacterium]
MSIDPGIASSLSRIASRESDLRAAYTPGAVPQNTDVFRPAREERTLDATSASAPVGTYFVRRAEDGQRAYSQDGKITLRGDQLVDAGGYAVLGTVPGTTDCVALRVDPVDAALGRVQNLRIDENGDVRYDRDVVEPRTGERVQHAKLVGRVALARFPAGTVLRPSDANHGTAPSGVLPHLGSAGDHNFAPLAVGQQRSSSIDIDRGLERLQDAYLALDALQAAHKASGSITKTTMGLIT